MDANIIPLVIKGNVNQAHVALASRGLHPTKLNHALPWDEAYAEVENTPETVAKVRSWFLENTHAEPNCPAGALLFYRYGDDA